MSIGIDYALLLGYFCILYTGNNHRASHMNELISNNPLDTCLPADIAAAEPCWHDERAVTAA